MSRIQQISIRAKSQMLDQESLLGRQPAYEFPQATVVDRGFECVATVEDGQSFLTDLSAGEEQCWFTRPPDSTLPVGIVMFVDFLHAVTASKDLQNVSVDDDLSVNADPKFDRQFEEMA